MSGFGQIWTHYQSNINSLEIHQKSAWVLLTVLFIVKYFPIFCFPLDALTCSDRADNAGSLEDRTRRFDAIVGKVVERWNFGLNQNPGGFTFQDFHKLVGADLVGEYIRNTPAKSFNLNFHLTLKGRRGLIPAQYDATLDEEGLLLKAQLKQLNRWSWPLREFSSLIDTQQRTPSSKDKSAKANGDWRIHQVNRWPAHVHAFIPGLFRMITLLQGFCNPANGGMMPFGLGDIGPGVDMSGWDEAAGNLALELVREDTPKTVRSLIRRIQKNVKNARDQAYQPRLSPRC